MRLINKTVQNTIIFIIYAHVSINFFLNNLRGVVCNE